VLKPLTRPMFDVIVPIYSLITAGAVIRPG